MGVDFYTCTYCKRNFPDCGNYYSCDCGYNFCSDKCAKAGTSEPDIEGEELKTCYLCRNEGATDNMLLIYLLNKYNLKLDDVLNEYLESVKENNV